MENLVPKAFEEMGGRARSYKELWAMIILIVLNCVVMPYITSAVI